MNLIRRYPLAAFFVLAYAISWAFGGPAVFFPNWPAWLGFMTTFGPVAAAMVVVAVTEGAPGLKALLAPLMQRRVGWRWWLVTLLGPALMMAVALAIFRLWRGPAALPGLGPWLGRWPVHIGVILMFIVYQLLFIWGEEVGWRGYALPHLQQRHHPLVASLILGLLWGFWHLPAFGIAGSQHSSMPLWFFILSSLGYTILYTWIYNGGGGSLLLMTLLHAANNATVSYVLMFYPLIQLAPVFLLMVLALFDGLVILAAGPRLGYAAQLKPDQTIPGMTEALGHGSNEGTLEKIC